LFLVFWFEGFQDGDTVQTGLIFNIYSIWICERTTFEKSICCFIQEFEVNIFSSNKWIWKTFVSWNLYKWIELILKSGKTFQINRQILSAGKNGINIQWSCDIHCKEPDQVGLAHFLCSTMDLIQNQVIFGHKKLNSIGKETSYYINI
jgi:hypothetical protein